MLNPTPPTLHKNLLTEWYNSTPFRLTDPERVDFIFKTLDFFFGRSFFDVPDGADKPIDKISWVFGLLANKDVRGCLFALVDICALIGYLTQYLSIELQKEAKNLQKNPENLRSFFYELFIYRLLDANRIYNLKKTKVGNQDLEGILRLDAIDYLFECRKIFMPNLADLDVKRRLMVVIRQVAMETQLGHSMICTILFKGKTEGKHLAGFSEKFKVFMKGLKKHTTRVSFDYHDDSELGTLSVVDFNETILSEIRESGNYDVICYCPEPKPIENSSLYHFQYAVKANFLVSQNKVYEKLEKVLKEKIKQHSGSPFTNKIFFFDNEILPEFQMNLFQREGMYDFERIIAIHKKLRMTEFVCFTRREYFNEGPSIGIDVIGPEGKEETAVKIKDLFTIMFSNPMAG